MKYSALVLVLAAASCHNVDWRKLGADEASCLAPAARPALEQVADQLVGAAEQAIATGHGPSSAEWKSAYGAIGMNFGMGVVACAAEHLIGDLFVARADAEWGTRCHRIHGARLEHAPYFKRIIAEARR